MVSPLDSFKFCAVYNNNWISSCRTLNVYLKNLHLLPQRHSINKFHHSNRFSILLLSALISFFCYFLCETVKEESILHYFAQYKDHGQLARWIKWRAWLILQPFYHFTYITTHSPTLLLLYLHHSSFSNPSAASPTSQFILQPFFRFSYVTSSSLKSPGKTPMTRTLTGYDSNITTLDNMLDVQFVFQLICCENSVMSSVWYVTLPPLQLIVLFYFHLFSDILFALFYLSY